LSSIDTAPAAVTEDPAVANDAPPVVSDVATVSETVLTPTPTPLESVRIGPVYLPTAQDGTVIVPRTTLLNFQGAGVTVSSFNGLVANITIAGSTSYGDANVINLLSSGIAGNIMPSANTTWNLGNATNQWNSLWVASNTIYIGGVPLSVAPGNTLTLAGEPLLSNDSATTITTTGNITANYIIGDGAQISNVAWANITGAPSFITLGNLSVTTASPSGNGSLSYNNTSGVFTYTPADANLSQYGNANVAGFLASFGSNVISTTGNITANYFIGDGSLLTGISSTGNITFTDTTMSPPDGQDLVISAANSQVDIQALDFRVVTTDDVRITGNDVVSLRNLSTTDPISIITDYDNTQKSWEFGADGTLTAPGDITTAGDITGTAGASTLVLRAQPASNTLIQLNNSVDSGISTVANFGVRTNVDGSVKQWLFDTNGDLTAPNYIRFAGNTIIGDEPGAGTPYFRIDTPLGYPATITTDADISGNNWSWTFGADSVLTAPGNIRMGNVSASAVSQINTVANSSGDGNGYTTLELIPDENLTGTDQYVILDPTAPGHIHIRAGGTQDNSSADLFLGGENSYVKLPAGQDPNVQIAANTHVWTFGSAGAYGELTLPVGEGAIRTIDDTLALVSLNTTTGNANSIYLGSSGGLGFYDQEIGGNWLEIFRSGAEPEIRVPVGRGNLNIQTAEGGNVYNWTFDNTGNLTVPGNITATRLKSDANLVIQSNVAGTARTWTFDTLGDLNLPAGGNISGSGNVTAGYFIGDGSLLTGLPASYSDSNVSTFLAAFGSNTISTTGNITAANFIGNVSLTGNITGTSANVELVAGSYTWTFDNTGNTAFANGTVTANDITLTGNISANVNGYSIGYREIPQVSLGANTTAALADSGKHFYSTTAGNLALLIPANANVAFPTGTAFTLVVQAAGNVLVNADSGVTLYMAGSNSAGNRVVGTYGMATVMKVASDTWFINGTGVY
jgi:hypothetical protein